MSRENTQRAKSLAKAALAKSNRAITVIGGGSTENTAKIMSMASSLGIAFSGNNVSTNQTNTDIQFNTTAINLLSTAVTSLTTRVVDLENASGASKSYGSFYLNGAGITGLGATEVTLTINSEGIKTSDMSLAGNAVTVNKDGNFSIDFHAYLNNSSTARVEYSMWLEQNGVEVVGTRAASYQRGYDSGMTSGTSAIIAITSGDVFTIQVQLTDGSTSSGYQDANGTRLNIVQL